MAGKLTRMDASRPNNERVTWWTYVQRHRGDDTNTAIGAKIGISGSAVGRWNKSIPDPTQAAAFARAYERPVLEAFVAAGFLTSEEANEQPSASLSLGDMSDDDLLDEIRRRMRGGQAWGGNPGSEDDSGGTSAAEQDERERRGTQIRGAGGRLTVVEPADEGLADKAAYTVEHDMAAEREDQWDKLGEESQDDDGMEPS